LRRAKYAAPAPCRPGPSRSGGSSSWWRTPSCDVPPCAVRSATATSASPLSGAVRLALQPVGQCLSHHLVDRHAPPFPLPHQCSVQVNRNPEVQRAHFVACLSLSKLWVRWHHKQRYRFYAGRSSFSAIRELDGGGNEWLAARPIRRCLPAETEAQRAARGGAG